VRTEAEILMLREGRSLPALNAVMDWEVDTNTSDNAPNEPALDLGTFPSLMLINPPNMLQLWRSYRAKSPICEAC
jgi:hypothetical protein